MGSAPVSDRLRAQIKEGFPNARVLNVYGTTEAGPVVFGPDPQGRPKPDAALGWPQPGVELKLVEGELWQRTPAVMLGYLNDPERTAAVLTPEGWYKSGDVFRRDENGCYWFVGRTDDMFVSGGENIFPSEVELVLARHPDVAQACVVPVPDEIKGAKPVAFVVPRAGHPDEDAIKRFVLANAPAYQHPRRIFLSELPLAGTNKVDRKALEHCQINEMGVIDERMKAAVIHEHGGPGSIQYKTDYPDPVPGAGEALVRVRACTLNYHDIFTRRGMPGIKVPMPAIMGLDFAGEIVALGADVRDWKLGERVMIDPSTGSGRAGSSARCAPAASPSPRGADAPLVRLPAEVSFEDAACLPVAYGTAIRMMYTIGQIQPKDRILVLGASGGWAPRGASRSSPAPR